MSSPRQQPEPIRNEWDLIRWVRARGQRHAKMEVGPGDDAAVLRLGLQQPCLATVDLMMEGVHFVLRQATARQVGRKALAINLSDIAAMAGRPVAALVSLALPRAGGGALGQELLDGMQELAEEFGVALAGGDTNCWDGPLVVSVTVLGEASPKGPVLRSGAQVGDWIFVSGSLGGSALGKHLEFQPRVAEALLLHERYPLHAMIDISDGLSSDLHHILDESHCGAILRADAIPVSQAAQALRDTVPPLEHALNDGEDFELLFTIAPEEGQRLLKDQPLDVPLTAIGEIVAEPGLWLVEPDGRRVPLPPKGWSHTFSNPDVPETSL